MRVMNNLEQFRHIHTFILDLDQAFSGPSTLVTTKGKLIWRFSKKDEFAVRHAIDSGYNIAVISREDPAGAEDRLRSLGVTDLFFETSDRLDAYTELLETHQYQEDGILYLGGDLEDLDPMMKAGLPACPFDSPPELISISKYISPFPGGDGCVRDVIVKVLKLHHNWPQV